MKKYKTFSLIELLVVIAILASLISLLTPSLHKVLKASEKLICQNNMKQLGVIFSFYTADNEDAYPTMHRVPGHDRISWTWDDYFMIYDKRSERGLSATDLDRDRRRWSYTPGYYTNDEIELYQCASDKREGVSVLLGREFISRSYSMTFHINNLHKIYRGFTSYHWTQDINHVKTRTHASINQTNRTILLTEYQGLGNTLSHLAGAAISIKQMTPQQMNDNFWSHGLWESNYLFVDGHIEYLNFTDTVSLSSTSPWEVRDTTGSIWDGHK